jgi:hypothetical protein
MADPEIDPVRLALLVNELGASTWKPPEELMPVIASEAVRYCRAAGFELTNDVLSVLAAVFTEGLRAGYVYAYPILGPAGPGGPTVASPRGQVEDLLNAECRNCSRRIAMMSTRESAASAWVHRDTLSMLCLVR